ncbi:FlxA-like family protein [Paenibacillus sp.]|jgi:hypothetical protein|uniref:FlxA-like family protein n=1 Tax=Paenibacillus sp. TaxID=58172 RepID=UPI002821D0AC|nr:FlxA-like family protein [Paenibacillus sp.]MDR0271268.1 FlxA-like family protein [Paenibacillus sp.]
MNTIQKAASSSSYRVTPISARDAEMQSLMKQRSLLNDKIVEVKSNQELNSKIKTERIKTLTTELQTIDAQIAQKQLEMQEKRKSDSSAMQSATSPSNPANHTNASSTSEPSLDHIATVSTLYNNIGKLSNVRSKLHSETVTIESEIKLDRLHLDGDSGDSGKASMRENAERTVIKKKAEQAAAIQAKVAAVDEKMGNEIKKVNQALQSKDSKPETDRLPDDQLQRSDQANQVVGFDRAVQTSNDDQQVESVTLHKAIDVRI